MAIRVAHEPSNMRCTKLLAVMIPVLVLSCGPTSILLVNLKTNDLEQCPVSENTDICVKKLEARGYKRVDQLTRGEKASMGVSVPR